MINTFRLVKKNCNPDFKHYLHLVHNQISNLHSVIKEYEKNSLEMTKKLTHVSFMKK